ncbi:MAG: hypothetical protein V3U62_08125 [Sedimenticolaceae bacterium]
MKHGKTHDGYKSHISIDRRHKAIRKYATSREVKRNGRLTACYRNEFAQKRAMARCKKPRHSLRRSHKNPALCHQAVTGGLVTENNGWTPQAGSPSKCMSAD